MTHHASVVTELVGVLPVARDFRFGNTPRGSVANVVKVNGAPPAIAYKVRLYRAADGILVAQTWSAPASGTYTFGDLELDQTYVPVALDHTGAQKPVAAGPLTPEADA